MKADYFAAAIEALLTQADEGGLSVEEQIEG